MKAFLKLILPLMLIGTLASGKEDNGVFVGLELGFGENKLTLSSPLTAYNGTASTTALIVGGKVGYKYFFLDWIGLRGYVNLDYAQTADGGTKYTDFIYGINADALFNFYSSEAFNAGAFIGLGLGGQNFETNAFGDTRSISDFYGDIKIGLRVNAAKNHEVEFIAKIPYYEAKKTFDGTVKAKTKQNYHILLGYNYAF